MHKFARRDAVVKQTMLMRADSAAPKKVAGITVSKLYRGGTGNAVRGGSSKVGSNKASLTAEEKHEEKEGKRRVEL